MKRADLIRKFEVSACSLVRHSGETRLVPEPGDPEWLSQCLGTRK